MYYVPINSNEEIPKRTKGYIMLDREFFEGRYWSIKRRYSKAEALIDLYAYVTYIKEGRFWQDKGKKIRLKRGEDVLSTSFLAKRWKWGRTTAFNFLHKLEEQGKIKQRMEQGENIIFLCDYEESQNPESYKWNTKRNGDGTKKEQERNEPNKEKKLKKEEINKQCDSSADEPPVSETNKHKSFDCEINQIASNGMSKEDKFAFDCFREYLAAAYGDKYRNCRLSEIVPCYHDYKDKKIKEVKASKFFRDYQEDFIRWSYILKNKPKSILGEIAKEQVSMNPKNFPLGLIEEELINRCGLTPEEVSNLPENML